MRTGMGESVKYVLFSILTLTAAFVLGALLSALLERARRASWTVWRRIATSAILGLIITLMATGAYLGTYYHADASTQSALKGNGTVEVHTIDEGVLFDGAGDSTALVFFPGAKVQTEAYAPLMLFIAERGVDCVLVDPPVHMAILGVGKGRHALSEYGYEHWIAGGHSLGGVAACKLATDASDQVDGIVLLASFPTAQIDAKTALLSIYGSEDRVLETSSYESGKAFWPTRARELLINGANHAGFGNYGTQQGDGKATIPAEEQQDLTAQAIIDLANTIADGE